MGNGQVGGNGSVHWEIVHEDDAGKPRNLSAKQGQGGHPGKADDVNVLDRARGKDGIELVNVGKRKGHRGRFRVRLRFETIADAQNAAAGAQNVMFEDGMFVLVLDVPVIDRDDPGDPPPFEVRIDW
jgi:hypothetical protein